MKKFISVVLCITMVLSIFLVVPFTAGAYETDSAMLSSDDLVESITVNPITIIEGTCGTETYDLETGEEYTYYHYWAEDVMEYKVTWKDGSVTSGTGSYVEYEGDVYYFDIATEQEYSSPWVKGNTYNMTVALSGVTVDVPVTIVETFVQSIEVEPVSIIEGTNGFIGTDYDDETEKEYEYYYYEPEDISDYKITWKDGSVSTGSLYNNEVEYQGEIYEIDIKTDQSYQNQWLPGNTYTMNVAFMGVTTEVPVTIEETPIKSLEVNPVSIVEGCYGEERNDPESGEDNKYFHYSLQGVAEYKITWKDGSVTQGGFSEGVQYQGKNHYFEVETDQSYSTPWLPGNTYKVKVMMLGATVEVPVTIEETPVESLVIEPVSVIEDTCGYVDYDWETGEENKYYYYSPYSIVEYTLTWKDGSVKKGTLTDEIEYQGKTYWFGIESGQSYTNQWSVGNTYTVNVNLLGVKVDALVTIEESPVESININPVSICEGTFGSIDYDWIDGEKHTYYRYFPDKVMEYTIKWKDGSVISGIAADEIEYNGKKYWIDLETNQSYYNQWMPGNTYTTTASFMGLKVDVPVTIEKRLLGDIDDDGVISVLDATEIQLHIAKLRALSDEDLAFADTDHDGEISVLDATRIQLYIAKHIPEL